MTITSTTTISGSFRIILDHYLRMFQKDEKSCYYNNIVSDYMCICAFHNLPSWIMQLGCWLNLMARHNLKKKLSLWNFVFNLWMPISSRDCIFWRIKRRLLLFVDALMGLHLNWHDFFDKLRICKFLAGGGYKIFPIPCIKEIKKKHLRYSFYIGHPNCQWAYLKNYWQFCLHQFETHKYHLIVFLPIERKFIGTKQLI